ncbi:CIS tube protein [Alteromonas sp. a30]|uniref:CIS tube protein n=1 Tax=Alteromonas sp. a30 TaxID=2730917 RepID=UPI0022822513|nr:hypothetical protein [Alteromonas sp. a30]MCY7294212.1 hypothetical protein [Alteromonas sp. a30]
MPINHAAIGSDAIATALTSRLEIRAYSDVKREKRQWDRGFVAPINPESMKIKYKNTLAGQVGLNSTGASLSVASNQAEEISFKLVLTDSSAFHYSGRNVFTLLNNYEADNFQNIGYSASRLLAIANEEKLKGLYKDTTFANSNVSPLHSGVNAVPLGARDGHVGRAIERFLNLTTQKTLKDGDKDAQNAYLGLVWGRVFNRPGGLEAGKFKAKRKKIYPCYLDSVDINYTHFTRDGRVLRAELDCVFKEDSSDNG